MTSFKVRIACSSVCHHEVCDDNSEEEMVGSLGEKPMPAPAGAEKPSSPASGPAPASAKKPRGPTGGLNMEKPLGCRLCS